ncbi:macrophage-expressed gene 1 protein-like [Pristis pectinata]|uniref:macrophage-expressed gene 1 protein-like n=1 Tax=Pristis pectinata TaxID=685728 RepID=UPI00223C9AE3|nr:macrophage-expressed gene 1 protein-like [Pristis pectinata]
MGFLKTSLVLVYAFLLVRATDNGLQEPTGDGFTECRKRQNLTALEVLPGGGWDNLRNLDRGRVMNISYSLCKTSEDGKYFIPDQVYVVPQKQTSMDIVSDMINSWMDYKSSTSASINSEVSFLSILNAKFSASFERVKTHQVRDSSMTTRIQVRNLMYRVKSIPNFQLDQGFKQQLIEIANYIENNQTKAADYYTQLLVLNYGTHVLTGVDAGASLVQVDQIKSSFVSDSWSRKSSISASAGATFFHTVNVGLSSQVESTDQFTRHYVGNRTHSRIESNGGVPFYPGITLQKWQQGLSNQLVAIDRSGLPLSFFVTPMNIPELPKPTVTKLSQAIERAITLYYTVNTHPGCVDLNSPNFNFQANLDDGSCKEAGTNFTFGGIYQQCTPLSGPGAQSLCQALTQKNPLTGAFSCPSGYSAIRLHSGLREEGVSQYECHRHCHSCWIVLSCCKDVCGDVYYVNKAHFDAYWCAATPGTSVPQNTGYLFGGLYGPKSSNPLTQGHSCPMAFYPLHLFQHLRVCVSEDYEMGLRYSLPFGGFFSCEAGNPLAAQPQSPGKDSAREEASAYPKRCPSGYSQHLAAISDSCQVLYCVRSGSFNDLNLAPINLPPFMHLPLLTMGSTNTVVVMSEYQEPWVKDTATNLWRVVPVSDARRLFGASPSRGPGVAAGISIAIILALVGMLGLTFYARKRCRNRGYQTLESEHLVISTSSCENAESQDSPDPNTDA